VSCAATRLGSSPSPCCSGARRPKRPLSCAKRRSARAPAFSPAELQR
jgi:hypothetical protein